MAFIKENKDFSYSERVKVLSLGGFNSKGKENYSESLRDELAAVVGSILKMLKFSSNGELRGFVYEFCSFSYKSVSSVTDVLLEFSVSSSKISLSSEIIIYGEKTK